MSGFAASSPAPVRRMSMRQDWLCLTFLHWAFDPAVVQRLLPAGLTVETFDGAAWVGVVPFRMQVRAARGPLVPWLSVFPETNVRTYVTAPDGSTGVWFFSLDAARLAAVAVARAGYRLPYFWSGMDVTRAGALVRYRSERRRPGPTAAAAIDVEVGAPIGPGRTSPLDQFLTARFRLFSAHRNGLRYANAEHAPWPLRSGRLVRLDEQLVTSAGLPAPEDDPRVLFSDGVSVRIGWPHRVDAISR